MRRATTNEVTKQMVAFYDRNPTRSRVRAGGPLATYYAGQRPGGVGPMVPSTHAMTADQDRALLLLSSGARVTIAMVRTHLGAFAARILRALKDLTARGLAVFEAGAYRLAEAA